MFGGGVEKEGKVFMRGGTENEAKLETGSLIMRLNKKALYKFYFADPVYWV